jgi:hypothetical protein
LAIAALFLVAGIAGAIQTQEVDLGLAGSYDGTVRITRDEAGRMLFQDQEIASPTALSALLASVYNFIEQLSTLGPAGTAPVSDGVGGLTMTDVGTQTELDAKADKSTTIDAGAGLLGGGDLSSNRTLSLDVVGAALGGTGQNSSAWSGHPAVNAGTWNAGPNITMADNAAIRLGAGAATIEFDDQALDEINLLNARVGIGTSTPGQSFHIYQNTAGGTRFRVENTEGFADFWSDNGRLFLGPGGVQYFDLGSATLSLDVNLAMNSHWIGNDGGSEGIRIDNAGNVEIGGPGGSKVTLNGSRLMNEVNLLDNPDFNIWQRATSTDADQGGDAGGTVTRPTPGLQTLGADRWQASRAGAGMTATISRATTISLATATYAMKIEATAGDPCRFYIHQTLTPERTRGLRGKWVTFAISHYLDGGADGGTIAIYKTVGGTVTELAHYTFVSTNGGWDRLAVAAQAPADAECLLVSIQSELSDGGPTTAFVANATLVEGRYVNTGERVTDPANSSVPPLPKEPAADLAACQRFFETGHFAFTTYAPDNATYEHDTMVHYNAAKGGAATMTLSNLNTGSMTGVGTATSEKPAYAAGRRWPQGFMIGVSGETSAGIPFGIEGDWTAEVDEPL